MTTTLEGTGVYPVVTTLLVVEVVVAPHTAQQQQAMMPTTQAINATNDSTLSTITTMNLSKKQQISE